LQKLLYVRIISVLAVQNGGKMGQNSHVGRAGQWFAVGASLLVLASGTAVAGTDAVPAAPGDAGATVIYRSLMPDGRLVLSDRPSPGASKVETTAYAAPHSSTPSAMRAVQEREYWRKQAEAFAERQRARELDADARRERMADRAAMARAYEVLGSYGYPAYFRSYLGVGPGLTGFIPTPGALGSGFSSWRN
jgi:hypothetical protein